MNASDSKIKAPDQRNVPHRSQNQPVQAKSSHWLHGRHGSLTFRLGDK